MHEVGLGEQVRAQAINPDELADAGHRHGFDSGRGEALVRELHARRRGHRHHRNRGWTQIGTDTTISMSSTTVHVGLAVTSASSANLATGVIDAVNLTGSIVP